MFLAFCVRKINFNSHAHVERDYQHSVCEEFKDISTHTLTWSVTDGWKTHQHRIYISTHTLTWSVTSRQAVVLTAVKHFNSHAHVERDGNNFDFMKSKMHFNSHAHVERDRYRKSYRRYQQDFNSHAHVERDRFEWEEEEC